MMRFTGEDLAAKRHAASQVFVCPVSQVDALEETQLVFCVRASWVSPRQTPATAVQPIQCTYAKGDGNVSWLRKMSRRLLLSKE